MKLYELAQTELRRSTRSNAFANQNSLKNKLPKILPPVKIFETSAIEVHAYIDLGETYGRYGLKNVLSGSFMNKDITYIANASEKEVSTKDIVMIRSMLFAGFNTLDVLLK